VNHRHSALFELERHVMRCRRRDEPAYLMLARVPVRSRATSVRLACCYRLTDSVAVARVGRHCEVVALFDDDGLDRAALEARLHAAAGVEPVVAWARFPDHGVTLEALLLAARMELRSLNGGAAWPARGSVIATPAAVDGK
jgi:hypothetical protein